MTWRERSHALTLGLACCHPHLAFYSERGEQPLRSFKQVNDTQFLILKDHLGIENRKWLILMVSHSGDFSEQRIWAY